LTPNTIRCITAPMFNERTSLSLSAPAMAFLRSEAERLGITVADLIRRIIDQYRAGKCPQ